MNFLSKVSQTIRTVSDSFLFGLARGICIVLAMLALATAVVMVFLALSTFAPSSFPTPEYGKEPTSQERDSIWGKTLPLADLINFQSLEPEDVEELEGADIRLSQEYGSDIMKLISRYKFKEADDSKRDKRDFSSEIKDTMLRIPENRRGVYLSGLDDWLDEGLSELEKSGKQKTESPVTLTRDYNRAFSRALSTARSDQAARLASRTAYAIALGISLLLYVVTMVVPLLCSIERNTRLALRQEAVPAPKTAGYVPAPSAVCPQCAKPISAGDAFCGECGARLG